MNLTEFLTARLDEDERAADAVVFACRDSRQPWPPEQAPGRGGPALTAYLEHFSETRAVREIEAKRAIVGAYQPSGQGEAYALEAGLEFALRHLAAAYSDHPDYRAEWKPRSGGRSSQGPGRSSEARIPERGLPYWLDTVRPAPNPLPLTPTWPAPIPRTRPLPNPGIPD